MKKRVIFLCVLAMLCLAVLPLVGAPAKTKLTVWGRDLTDDDPAHAYVKALVAGFQAKYPEIELEYIALGDPGLADKTKIAMANKTGPDIFQTWGGSVMGGYADAKRLLDLTKELKDVPGSAAAAGAMTWKKKIYGVAPFFAIAGVFYNVDIFKANGIAVPKTFEELEKAADTLLAADIQPFACGAKDKWPPIQGYMYLTNRFGGDSFAQAQSRNARFDSEGFVKAAQKYQEWTKKGYFGEQPLGEAYGDAQQLMATGMAGMHITGSWMCAQYSSASFTDQNIGFFAFPAVTGGKGKITDVMGMTDIGWAATALAAKKKDAVVKFMKFAMSPEICSADPGRICGVPGVKAPSALTEQASAVFASAQTVTFWWDQDLPPAIASPLNDTIQMFFLQDTDVKKALAAYEDLAEEAMGAVKK